MTNKIKLADAKAIDAKITSLQTELMHALKEADSMGLVLNQHTCKGTLDRYTYIITGIKVYIDDLEV